MEATLTVRVTRSINCDVLIGQPLDSPNADYLGVHVLVACHSTSSLPVRAAAACPGGQRLLLIRLGHRGKTRAALTE